MRPRHALILGLFLILAGDLLAWSIQTDGGRVQVEDIRWTGAEGTRMSGLLYIPPHADPGNPAPGVLAVHGYLNSRETQAGFAIELARRGFVVLAMDQTGHGYSDPPAFANGFGGPDGLAYLRSLDFVDARNIGLEGHSMGGWAVLLAAAAFPQGYRSVVLEGSSTGTSGAPEGTESFPRNLAVVFSRYDEFSRLMWGTAVPGRVPESEKLRAVFGVQAPVEVGRIYGSLEEGTARVLHQPPVIHPGDHFSTAAIGHALDWFQTTLPGARNPLPPDDQVWRWKEVGNLTALVGMIILLLAMGTLLLKTPFFRELAQARPGPARGPQGMSWAIAAATFVLLPAVTLFPFTTLGGMVSPSAFLPQGVTNQIVVWALLVAVISSVFLAGWQLAVGRKVGITLKDYGLIWGGGAATRRVPKAFLLAALTALAGYLALLGSAFLFHVDFRFWVFAVKPLSSFQARAFLSYLTPFILFFGVYCAVLQGQLRRRLSPLAEGALAVTLSTGGFVLLLVVQYAPLLAGGTLAIPSQPLWTIIAFQFLPLMAIGAVLTGHFHRLTGDVLVGAFLCGIFTTWTVVASQPIHFGF